MSGLTPQRLTSAGVVPLLFADVEGLETEWSASRGYHYDTVEPPEPWQVIFDLTPVLVERLRSGDVQPVANVLARLENVLPRADQGARNLLLVGLIEGLQNHAMHGSGPRMSRLPEEAGPDGFVPFLGPLGREAWDAVNASWQGDPEPMRRLHSEEWPP